MKRLALAGLAIQLLALPALAQNTQSPTSGPGVAGGMGVATPTGPGVAGGMGATTPSTGTTTTDTTVQNGVVPGANSFTENQARTRLEKNGFTQVSGLAKGNDGIWHGSAMRSGNSVQVSVDYKGHISTN